MKGKIKKYDSTGLLILEGEYINGKTKGKEYNSKGKLIFEGEFLNGQRWNGKGKEYNSKGVLIFEGEYLNGQRWNGKGKEYNDYDYECDIYISEKAIDEFSVETEKSVLVDYEYSKGEKKKVKNYE